MWKAKELLNSSHKDIPPQIRQDLASTYPELEPNFIAVSQRFAERNDSLIQAMEAKKVCVKMADRRKLNEVTVYIWISNSFVCDFSLAWNQHTRNISVISVS